MSVDIRSINDHLLADEKAREKIEVLENQADESSEFLNQIILGLSDPLEAEGNPLVIKPVGGLPFDSVVTKFTPKQEGSGDPSPENIRSFIGYDKLGLDHTGKNLFNSSFVTDRTQGGLTTARQADGSIRLTGTAEGTTRAIMPNSVRMFTLQPGTYTLKPDNFAIRYIVNNIAYYYTGTFTVDVDREIVQGLFYVKAGQAYDETVRIQLESGSTASSYETYQHKLHTAQIGQTVYGGKFDWLTGKCLIEWGCRAFDGTESWYYSSSEVNPCFSINLKTSDNKHAYSSHYKFKHAPYIYEGESGIFGWESLSQVLYITSAQHATVDAWKAYLAAQYAAGTPVQIAYKLATPIEIQLTPAEIIALQGVNTLYGDGDSIAVKGRQPKTIDLEERIAALEAAVLLS